MKAAKKSANWTEYTAIIGLIGTIAVALSLFLSARANEVSGEALKISLLQTRPWVKLTIHPKASFGADTPDLLNATMTVSIQAENFGQTPAVQYGILHEFLDTSKVGEWGAVYKDFTDGRKRSTGVLFPRDPEKGSHEFRIPVDMLDWERRGSLGLFVVAQYKTAGDQTLRLTPLAFRVEFGTTNTSIGGSVVGAIHLHQISLDIHPT